MKKISFMIAIAALISFSASAQEKVTKDEVKVRRTATVPQRVHNTFSKHKRHSGVKVKHVEKMEKTNR